MCCKSIILVLPSCFGCRSWNDCLERLGRRANENRGREEANRRGLEGKEEEEENRRIRRAEGTEEEQN